MSVNEGSAVASVEWSGQAGYERTRERYAIVAPDPDRYRASLRIASVDGVRVGEWTTSPVSGVGRRPDAATSALIIAVTEGRLRYATDAGVVEGRSGSVHVLAATAGVRFTVAERSTFHLAGIPADLLQQPMRFATTRSIGPVAATRITAGLSSLTEAVLETGGAASPAARAIRALAVAAIEDSIPRTEDHDLRSRILDHIERHLADVDLGPQSIAADFGISLRWVHHVFNDGESSIARHIRQRRLDVVAAQLRDDHRFPRIGALAERAGFASRDQLTRAFKSRFGMTIGDYAAHVATAS